MKKIILGFLLLSNSFVYTNENKISDKDIAIIRIVASSVIFHARDQDVCIPELERIIVYLLEKLYAENLFTITDLVNEIVAIKRTDTNNDGFVEAMKAKIDKAINKLKKLTIIE